MIVLILLITVPVHAQNKPVASDKTHINKILYSPSVTICKMKKYLLFFAALILVCSLSAQNKTKLSRADSF
jgi:hypothetical protein